MHREKAREDEGRDQGDVSVRQTSQKLPAWTSLVAKGLRIHLLKRETQAPSLAREYPTCHGATKPMGYSYRAHMLQLLKPASRARALQQEKPPQWGEARAPQLESSPRSPQLEKSPGSSEDPA